MRMIIIENVDLMSKEEEKVLKLKLKEANVGYKEVGHNENKKIKLYYHKTDGGAEYLTDKFMKWSHNGKSGKEGIFEGAKYIVRIDGDIEKDAEIFINER